MQKARRHPVGLRPLVSARFQVLLTSLFEILFTFPSRYLFTIGLSGVFSLTRWCWQFHARILRPSATQDTSPLLRLRLRGFHPLRLVFPEQFCSSLLRFMTSYNPDVIYTGLGFSAFARHYLRNHFLIFFSCRYLDVSVPRVARLAALYSSNTGVSPFGHLCIDGCLHLHTAFRSLPRPSSSLRA